LVLLLSLLLSPISCSDFSRFAAKIGATRFELATSRSRTVRSIQAELRPVNACSNDLSDLAGSVNSIRFALRRIGLRGAYAERKSPVPITWLESARQSPVRAYPARVTAETANDYQTQIRRPVVEPSATREAPESN
jgi:hypothetical protein